MTEGLKNKLQSALNENFEKECQVVFVLSIIRKILENEKLFKTFPILKIYTDWALHIEITNTKPIQSILKKLEDTIGKGEYSAIPLFEIVDFVEFKKQLLKFLDLMKINNNFLKNEYWRTFRGFFVDAITDCPIKSNSGEIVELSFKKSGPGLIILDVKLRNRSLSIRANFSMIDC